VLLEPATRQFEQLRRCFQVGLRPDEVLVAEICRQQWQPGLDIHALIGPSREPMHGERVAELVRACADTAIRRFDVEFAQQPPDRT
jgi:hypothetical protein